METGAVSGLAHGMDFSILQLFLQAHWVVKVVMVLLVLASFWSWAIIFEKFISFRRARRDAENFETAFWSGQSLDDIYDALSEDPRTSAERVFASGMREWRRSFESGGAVIDGARDRIDRAMSAMINREMDRYEGGLGFLATVGSISPFVGLFGTVWGIKNSFESIAASQSTNLAVVAPGIAEALVATALGLLTAIPAVMAYNALSDRLNRFGGRLEGFADEFSSLLSRQLQRQSAPQRQGGGGARAAGDAPRRAGAAETRQESE